jgi:L-amino acid N-acyltransferase YncA
MIRPAKPADLATITAIYNEAIIEGGLTGDLVPLTSEDRCDWFDRHQGRYAIHVLIVDDAVVGYTALSPYRNGRGAFRRSAEISYYLASSYRGHGYGKTLVGHAIDIAMTCDFHLLVAMILACNRRSIGLLEAHGFTLAGRLPHAAEIAGAAVDHVFLCRSLDRRDEAVAADRHSTLLDP